MRIGNCINFFEKQLFFFTSFDSFYYFVNKSTVIKNSLIYKDTITKN